MPAVSQPSTIAIFEKQPYWGPELQRQFQHTETAIRECRSLRDLSVTTQSVQDVVWVIDLEAGLEQSLEWLANDVAQLSFTVPIIVIGSPASAELEWILREAGVTAFLPELVTGEDLARLCRRMLSPRTGSLKGHQP